MVQSQKSDKSSLDQDHISIHANNNLESPAKNVRSKNSKKSAAKAPAKTKKAIAAELRVKQEEKSLKKEYNLLEFEVTQSEKNSRQY